MNVQNGKFHSENNDYNFVLTQDKSTLLFHWEHVVGLSVDAFKKGIAEYADTCKALRPARGIINAMELDQGSPAVAWLRSQLNDAGGEDYMSWWIREIVPVYNEAGISSIAVATGDPNAPGELANLPPQVGFKMGYFVDLDASVAWKAE